MVLRNPEGAPSVEDLAVGINAVSSSIETAGHGERLLCAVFALHRREGRARSTSSTTTSAATGTRSCPPPARQQERSTERELQIKAQIGAELPIEPELERWFPLWGIPI